MKTLLATLLFTATLFAGEPPCHRTLTEGRIPYNRWNGYTHMRVFDYLAWSLARCEAPQWQTMQIAPEAIRYAMASVIDGAYRDFFKHLAENVARQSEGRAVLVRLPSDGTPGVRCEVTLGERRALIHFDLSETGVRFDAIPSP